MYNIPKTIKNISEFLKYAEDLATYQIYYVTDTEELQLIRTVYSLHTALQKIKNHVKIEEGTIPKIENEFAILDTNDNEINVEAIVIDEETNQPIVYRYIIKKEIEENNAVSSVQKYNQILDIIKLVKDNQLSIDEALSQITDIVKN